MNSRFSTGLLILTLALIFILASFTSSASTPTPRIKATKKFSKKNKRVKKSVSKPAQKLSVVKESVAKEKEVIKDDIIVGYNDGTDEVQTSGSNIQNIQVTDITIEENPSSDKTIDSIEVVRMKSQKESNVQQAVYQDQDQNQTKFNELLSRFQNETQPTDNEKIKGWWSGRCYHTSEQDRPYGSVLLIEDVRAYQGNAIHGPLWPPQIVKVPNMSIANQNGVEENPGRYDNLSKEDALTLERYTKSDSFRNLKMTVSENILQSTNTVGNLKYLAKQSKDFILVKVQVIDDQEIYKANDVHSMCYYFRKLR